MSAQNTHSHTESANPCSACLAAEYGATKGTPDLPAKLHAHGRWKEVMQKSMPGHDNEAAAGLDEVRHSVEGQVHVAQEVDVDHLKCVWLILSQQKWNDLFCGREVLGCNEALEVRSDVVEDLIMTRHCGDATPC